MPKQEMWIARKSKDLPFSVFLSGGAVFDYLSEEILCAPYGCVLRVGVVV